MTNKLESYIERKNFTELSIVPVREKRVTSKLFLKNKLRMKRDGHWKCFICGCSENLEVHHFLCEYSMKNVCDFQKLKDLAENIDPYGYGNLMKNLDLTNIDDIRNLLVLCLEHHRSGDADGVANGIHNITWNTWIMQKITKSGEISVPLDQNQLDQHKNGIQA